MLTIATYTFVLIFAITVTAIVKYKLRLSFHPFAVFWVVFFSTLILLPSGCTHMFDESQQTTKKKEVVTTQSKSSVNNINNKNTTVKQEDSTTSKIVDIATDAVIENVGESSLENSDKNANDATIQSINDKILVYEGKGLEVYVKPDTIVNYNDGYFEVTVLENNRLIKYEFFREGLIWQFSASTGSGRIENSIYVQKIFEACQQYR